MRRTIVVLGLVLIFAFVPGVNASPRLPVIGTVTLATCVELSSNDISCEMEYSLQGLALSGLYTGDFVVLTCEPNAHAFAVSIACDAKFSQGSKQGDKLSIEQGDRISFSDCLAQSIYAWPAYDDPRMLPFIRVDCELSGPTSALAVTENPWIPDVAPHNPDDVVWPPITSGYSFPSSECVDSGDGSYACVPSEPAERFLMPEEPRLSTGDRVAISVTAGGEISITFVPSVPQSASPGEGAYAGDQITFSECTGSLIDGWVYMRTIYCVVGPIKPGPRPR